MKKHKLLLFPIFFSIIFWLMTSPLYSAESTNQSENSGSGDEVIFQIITDPHKAEVYIDNIFIGTSPLLKLRAAKGIYSVKIFKSGYEVHESKINLTAEGQKFAINLIKKPWLPAQNNFTVKGSIPFFSELEHDLKFSLTFAYRYMFPNNHPLKNFDIEFTAGIINMDIYYQYNGVPNSGKTKLTVLPIAVNFHFNILRNFPWVSPYVGIGFGATIINVALDNYEKTSLTFAVIGGINFFTQLPVSFQIEVKYVWLGTANIVETASGSPITVNTRKLYSLKGFLFNFGVVGRF